MTVVRVERKQRGRDDRETTQEAVWEVMLPATMVAMERETSG